MKHNIKEDALFNSKFLNTGADITATWDLAKNAIAVGLSQENSMTVLHEFIEQLFSSPELEDEWPVKPLAAQLQPLLNGLFQKSGTKELIALYVHCLDQNPHTVNRLKLVITELAFLQSNRTKLPPAAKAFINHNLIFLLANSGSLIASALGSERTTIGMEDINKILSFYQIDSSQSKDYETGFAFALRQSTVSQVSEFLWTHKKQFSDEVDYLIFLDTILLDYQALFEPKTIEAAQKWTERREEVLLEPTGEVFHFSEKITDNRKDILKAWDTLKIDSSYLKQFQERYIKKKAWHDYCELKGYSEKAYRAALSIELDKPFLSEPFESSVKLIESKPFDVFPLVIFLTEQVHFIATNDGNYFNQINKKAKAYLERRGAILHKSLKEGSAEAISLFHKKWVEEPLKCTDADFPFFFAYALRQQSASILPRFLDYHLDNCQRPLGSLLREVCEDYATLLSPEVVERITAWKQKRSAKLHAQKTQIEAKAPSLPDDYKLIETGLTQEEVKNCFAFLHEVKDDDGNSFLSKADYDEVFRYGLAIPTGRISEPTAGLYLDGSNFSLAVILHFMHKFAKSIQKRKGRSIQSLRSGLALFLFVSFKDFYTPYVDKDQSIAIKAIRKRINSQKNPPFRSEKVTFDKYLPV